MFGTTKPSLLTAEQGNKNDGTILTVTLERTGIGIPLKQQLPPDFTILKFFKRMWPRIEGTSGGVVICEAGVQQEIGGAVRWLPAQNFTIGTSKHIDFRGCGRLLAVRFSSSSDITWQLLGYELDVKFGGNF